MTANRKDTTRRRKAFAVAVLAALAVIAGCEIPHKVGLMSTFGTDGVYGETELDLTELPVRLTLTGGYEVIDGSLSVAIHAPDGSVPYAATWHAGERGELNHELVPQTGTWRIVVESDGGRGSYDVWLAHGEFRIGL